VPIIKYGHRIAHRRETGSDSNPSSFRTCATAYWSMLAMIFSQRASGNRFSGGLHGPLLVRQVVRAFRVHGRSSG
jgi:hypothetical protein